MNRRTALRHVVLISAGAILYPSCRNSDRTFIKLKNVSISGSQYDLLAAMTETILPGDSKFPGAKELKTDEFLVTMLDDCASPEDQKKFMDGMKAFEVAADKKLGTSFPKASESKQLQWLKELDAIKENPDESVNFYKAVKGITLQNFTTSQKFMTEVLKYKIIPGSNFKGCVPV